MFSALTGVWSLHGVMLEWIWWRGRPKGLVQIHMVLLHLHSGQGTTGRNIELVVTLG